MTAVKARSLASRYVKELEKEAKRKQPSQEDLQKAERFFIDGVSNFMRDNPEQAYTNFQRALQIDPLNAAIHFNLAQLLHQYPELEEQSATSATVHAYTSIKLAPDNKFYYLSAVEIYISRSQYKEATAIYKKMLRQIPPTDEQVFDLANLYIHQQAYSKAIKVYNRLEKKRGVVLDIIFRKQAAYLLQNRLDKAVAAGEKLIKAHPHEEDYILILVEILAVNDHAKEAIPYLLDYLAMNPDHVYAKLRLVQLYIEEGDLKDVETYAKEILTSNELPFMTKLELMVAYIGNLPHAEAETLAKELATILVTAYPNEAYAHAVFGDLYFIVDDKAQAQKNYLNALQLDSTNYKLWDNIITISLEQNAIDSVLSFSEEALKHFPDKAAFYYYKGVGHRLKKQYQEAANAFEKGEKRANDSLALVNAFNSQLGDVYSELKKYSLADACYEAVLNFDNDNYYVLNNYSYFLALRKEKLPLANQMAAMLIEDNPDNPTYLDTYGWVLYMMGNYEEAKKQLEKAIEIMEEEATGEILEHYGDVLYRLGKKKEAVEQWEKAKDRENVSALIHQKLKDQKLYE